MPTITIFWIKIIILKFLLHYRQEKDKCDTCIFCSKVGAVLCRAKRYEENSLSTPSSSIIALHKIRHHSGVCEWGGGERGRRIHSQISCIIFALVFTSHFPAIQKRRPTKFSGNANTPPVLINLNCEYGKASFSLFYVHVGTKTSHVGMRQVQTKYPPQ